MQCGGMGCRATIASVAGACVAAVPMGTVAAAVPRITSESDGGARVASRGAMRARTLPAAATVAAPRLYSI